MFRARRLTRGFLMIGTCLGLGLPLGGCGGSSDKGPPVMTEEQKRAEEARQKLLTESFKDYQKGHKPGSSSPDPEKHGKGYHRAP